MTAHTPGECIERAPLIAELDFSHFRMRVSTERYSSPAFHARERERLWMRCWQVAGRADEIPAPGDWKVHAIFDQSFLVVRGKDGAVRGFVNACRHRGNALCAGKGHAGKFTCPYHRWQYGLDGALIAVPRPDFKGGVEEFVGPRDELGLVEVPVACFAGFIFLNPDPAAEPLSAFLGETAELLAPYRLDEMVPVGMDVRESIGCNWKVVMDAFQEGYHIQGIHPELIAAMDEAKERYGFFGDHSIATAPFGTSNLVSFGPERQVEAIRELPAVFPGVAAILPRFEEIIAEYRTGATYAFPDGITARGLLQKATRDTLSAKGLDVSGLTDTQMSDNHFYLLFPNLFMTIRAGEATAIISVPHPDGDPNRCVWQTTFYQWLPPAERAAARVAPVEVAEGDHFPYFLALEQDYHQMERQQEGLRNAGLGEMALTRQEVRLAHFHSVLDAWLDRPIRSS